MLKPLRDTARKRFNTPRQAQPIVRSDADARVSPQPPRGVTLGEAYHLDRLVAPSQLQISLAGSSQQLPDTGLPSSSADDSTLHGTGHALPFLDGLTGPPSPMEGMPMDVADPSLNFDWLNNPSAWSDLDFDSFLSSLGVDRPSVDPIIEQDLNA